MLKNITKQLSKEEDLKTALVSFDIFQGNSTGLYPPLHLCNLATTLELSGIDVKVFDYASSFSEMEFFFKKIKDYNPDILGMTCYTPFVGIFNKITKKIRKYVPNAAMVAGGPHPSVWPEWTLNNMPHFDYAMQGECDRSIKNLAEMIQGKISEPEVPGLVFKQEGKIKKNKRDFIDDLNCLPQVKRKYLKENYKSKMYWDMAAEGNLDMMISSRGCPYNCNFCFKLEKKYRFRSAESLMLEFETLKSSGIKSIHIQDDAFTANKKRCIEIAENLIKEKHNFDIKIRSRVNSIDEELLAKLKKAGVKKIIYGIESGSQTMLDSMNKKTTVEMNRRAIQLTKNAGIGCYAEIMIGMPNETKKTINQTIDFLLETKPIVGFIPVLYPLPETKVYNDAKEEGTLQGDWRLDGSRPWVKLPWTQCKSDLEKESRRISKTIQKDPGTIFYFLKTHLKTMSWKQIKFLFRLAKDFHMA
jgi:radical SAM superfamily enzyme YgiQ (UPF0313 family)